MVKDTVGTSGLTINYSCQPPRKKLSLLSCATTFGPTADCEGIFYLLPKTSGVSYLLVNDTPKVCK